MMLQLNTQTKYGTIAAVGLVEGERYYWIIDKRGVISMIPAKFVEEEENEI